MKARKRKGKERRIKCRNKCKWVLRRFIRHYDKYLKHEGKSLGIDVNMYSPSFITCP